MVNTVEFGTYAQYIRSLLDDPAGLKEVGVST
jgi:hypothetical protein